MKWPRSKNWICYYGGKEFLLDLLDNLTFNLIEEILPPTEEQRKKSNESLKDFFKKHLGVDVVDSRPSLLPFYDLCEVKPMSAPLNKIFYFELHREKKQTYKVLDGKIREIKIW